MSKPKDHGRDRPTPPVVRRARDERKRLPAELEAFAAGDDDALWRRARSRDRMDDPRPVAASLVPGVANRDARAVFDARIKRLRAAVTAGDDESLRDGLADAVRLGLWRANAIVGFDVMAEAVLGVPSDRARALAKEGAAVQGEECQPADEATVALWMRAEAGLLEASPDARVWLRRGTLRLEIAFDRAADGLSGVGRRAAPMSKIPQGPEVVVDRPHGVAPLSRILERDRPRDE